MFLALEFGGEIVNFDSIQLYRGLDIGSAKPGAADRRKVPHHLIDILDPRDPASAGDYQRRAREVLAGIRARGRLPVLVGGTGFYLKALVEGLFSGPERSESLRARLTALGRARGPEYLHALLGRVDPDAHKRIQARDVPKVIRALEVRFLSGRPLSEHLAEGGRDPIRGFAFAFLGLRPPREHLYEHIGDRVQGMYRAGLVEEVRGLLSDGVPPGAPAFRAIGYRQVVGHICDGLSLDEAIMSTRRETCRYARRQLTWFRRQHPMTWFEGFGGEGDIRAAVGHFTENFLGGFPDGS
jgi:tRNA dimethylallyltransferase